jgi:ankyrin repeat protein
MNKQRSIIALILILNASNVTAGRLLHNLIGRHDVRDNEVEDFIIRNPALVNDKDNAGWTPLHTAAHWGHARIAEMLVYYGADINAIKPTHRDEIHMGTALGLAVHGQKANVVKVLLAAQARTDLDLKRYSSGPAVQQEDYLEWAAQRGDIPTVDVLLQAQYPVSSNALHEAANWGDPQLVLKLIQAGAPVDKSRLGKCGRNHKYYPAVFPILLRASSWISSQEEMIIKENINQNQVWSQEEKQEMIHRVCHIDANL